MARLGRPVGDLCVLHDCGLEGEGRRTRVGWRGRGTVDATTTEPASVGYHRDVRLCRARYLSVGRALRRGVAGHRPDIRDRGVSVGAVAGAAGLRVARVD